MAGKPADAHLKDKAFFFRFYWIPSKSRFIFPETYIFPLNNSMHDHKQTINEKIPFKVNPVKIEIKVLHQIHIRFTGSCTEEFEMKMPVNCHESYYTSLTVSPLMTGTLI